MTAWAKHSLSLTFSLQLRICCLSVSTSPQVEHRNQTSLQSRGKSNDIPRNTPQVPQKIANEHSSVFRRKDSTVSSCLEEARWRSERRSTGSTCTSGFASTTGGLSLGALRRRRPTYDPTRLSCHDPQLHQRNWLPLRIRLSTAEDLFAHKPNHGYPKFPAPSAGHGPPSDACFYRRDNPLLGVLLLAYMGQLPHCAISDAGAWHQYFLSMDIRDKVQSSFITRQPA